LLQFFMQKAKAPLQVVLPQPPSLLPGLPPDGACRICIAKFIHGICRT